MITKELHFTVDGMVNGDAAPVETWFQLQDNGSLILWLISHKTMKAGPISSYHKAVLSSAQVENVMKKVLSETRPPLCAACHKLVEEVL